MSKRSWNPLSVLNQPLRWRKAHDVTVEMDLFGDLVAEDLLCDVFNVIRICHAERRGHTFRITTSYPDRLRHTMRRLRFDGFGYGHVWLADSDDDGGYPLGPGHRGATGLTNLVIDPAVWPEDRA